jgi:hypothetical protein
MRRERERERERVVGEVTDILFWERRHHFVRRFPGFYPQYESEDIRTNDSTQWHETRAVRLTFSKLMVN